MQGRNEGENISPGAESLRGLPKSSNNVASTFFNTVHLLPKDLRFEHGAVKLASMTPGAIQCRYAPAWCCHEHEGVG